MDIDLLSKMVKELILDHDKVSLPGLGTFVAETVPSTFSDKGYTINPPYRKLSFRPQTGDDTLLADLYASVNGVDSEIAVRVLNDFVSGLKSVLETRKNVVFPGLGRLRATRENNFFFIADENLEIYPEGFGLLPVSLKTHVETREEVSAAVESLADIIADTANDASVEEETVNGDGNDVMPEEAETPVMEREPVGIPETAAAEAAPDGGVCRIPDGTETDASDRGGRNKVLYWGLAAFLAIILLLVLYVVVSRMFPGVIDRILYDREELDILRYGGMNSWL